MLFIRYVISKIPCGLSYCSFVSHLPEFIHFLGWFFFPCGFISNFWKYLLGAIFSLLFTVITLGRFFF